MCAKPKNGDEKAGRAWAWRKRDERHATAKQLVQRVLVTEPGMETPQLPNVTRLYDRFIIQAYRDLKIRNRGEETCWWFAEWRNEAGEWYVCILAPVGHTFQSALVDLCEVLAEVELGFRKPTRVERKPKPSA